MNSYYGLHAAQAVFEDRTRKYREPTDLGRPQKARHNRLTGTVSSRPGIFDALHSMAHTMATLLI